MNPTNFFPRIAHPFRSRTRMYVNELTVIRIANVMKMGDRVYKEPQPSLIDGYLEFEVTDEMKKFWDSLSERERETILNISTKQRKDLRDLLSERM